MKVTFKHEAENNKNESITDTFDIDPGKFALMIATDRQQRAAESGVPLTQRRWGPPHVSQGRVARAVYGTLAGFTTMAANAGGPVTSMYFLASRFSVSESGHDRLVLLHGQRHQGTLHDRHGSAASRASAHHRVAGTRGTRVRVGGVPPGGPHPPAHIRVPRYRDNNRGDGAAARIKKLSARASGPRRQLSLSELSMRWARTRWKQCELVVEL